MARPVWVNLPTGNGRSRVTQTKPFQISKHLVYEAYKRVKANKGSAGVDGESLKAFEADLKNVRDPLTPAYNSRAASFKLSPSKFQGSNAS